MGHILSLNRGPWLLKFVNQCDQILQIFTVSEYQKCFLICFLNLDIILPNFSRSDGNYETLKRKNGTERMISFQQRLMFGFVKLCTEKI